MGFVAMATTHTINSGNYYYAPSSLTINVNDTVVWINDAGYHDVNFDIDSQTGSSFGNPESFQSVATGDDTLYVHVFTIPGSYNYDCSIGAGQHAVAGMTGSIEVLTTNTVYDIVSNSPDHTTLQLAIDTCELDGTLSGSGPFTLFAPTNAAFDNLPPNTLTSLLSDLPTLTNILLHHVHGDSVMSGMLSDGDIVTTLLGTDLTVTIDASGAYIDNAMITIVDQIADNGVVHIIDAVLLPPPSNTVYDIVSNSPDHTTLQLAIDTCELDGTLSGSGPFTLFAPTNAAFDNLPPNTLTSLLSDLPTLTNILLHHVHGDSVMSGMLSDGDIVTTLLGTDLTVTIDASGAYIDNAMITIVDQIADNGVVHIIDAVLLPPPSNTVYDIVSNSPDHTTLQLAIDTCELDSTLSGSGPFTLFAPTNAAFDNLPPNTLTSLLSDLPTLTNILLHHVHGDSVMSGMLSDGDIVTTLFGTDLTVTIDASGAYIDNAMITIVDQIADNGVVHIIDAVLLPPTSTTISELEETDFVVKSIDIMGKIVENKHMIRNKIIIDIYKSGKVVKRMNF